MTPIWNPAPRSSARASTINRTCDQFSDKYHRGQKKLQDLLKAEEEQHPTENPPGHAMEGTSRNIRTNRIVGYMLSTFT